MNAFQQRCSQSIVQVLSRRDMELEFTEQPNLPPSEDGAAMFLRADLVHGDRHYKLYVYPEGVGANVGRNWYVLQQQDFDSPEALMDTFCAFLQGCLDGSHPVTALQQARR